MDSEVTLLIFFIISAQILTIDVVSISPGWDDCPRMRDPFHGFQSFLAILQFLQLFCYQLM